MPSRVMWRASLVFSDGCLQEASGIMADDKRRPRFALGNSGTGYVFLKQRHSEPKDHRKAELQGSFLRHARLALQPSLLPTEHLAEKISEGGRRMLKCVVPLVFSFVAMLFLSTSAQAACGYHKSPSYTDVTLVEYEKMFCDGTCPIYRVAFTRRELYYHGGKFVRLLGDYEAPGTDEFTRVVAALSEHHFFRLSVDTSALPPFGIPTWAVAVFRCGVLTQLEWENFGSENPDIVSLFQVLDAITMHTAWKRTKLTLSRRQIIFWALPSP